MRDALTAYVSFFSRDVYVKVLRWLKHVYKTRSSELDTIAFMSMIHLCMFLRHEDSREQIGRNILSSVIKHSKAARKLRTQNEIIPTPITNTHKGVAIFNCKTILNDIVMSWVYFLFFLCFLFSLCGCLCVCVLRNCAMIKKETTKKNRKKKRKKIQKNTKMNKRLNM